MDQNITIFGHTVVVSLGGSLVVPDEIDLDFLRRFKQNIEEILASKPLKFVIVVGGGKISRKYQEAARVLGPLLDEDIDWLGVHCTRLNAHFIRTIFRNIAHPRVFSSSEDIVEFSERLAVGAGWRPGWSTDYVAVSIAEKLNARFLINLSNMDYVYDKDPKVFEDAVKMENISWREYRKFIPESWSPGLSTPFDPIASRKAEELGLEVAIINGNDLGSFKNLLLHGYFNGTFIHQ